MPNRPFRASVLRIRRFLSRPDVVARAFGVLVLLTGFIVTGVAAYLTAHHERTESETVSAHRAEQIASVIESRFALYTALVRGGEALFASSARVERADWRAFGVLVLLTGFAVTGAGAYEYQGLLQGCLGDEWDTEEWTGVVMNIDEWTGDRRLLLFILDTGDGAVSFVLRR